jgi:hypothetical protein
MALNLSFPLTEDRWRGHNQGRTREYLLQVGKAAWAMILIANLTFQGGLPEPVNDGRVEIVLGLKVCTSGMHGFLTGSTHNNRKFLAKFNDLTTDTDPYCFRI